MSMLGILAPLCADRWCSDSCSLEAKHTDTIFNVVRQIAYIHRRGPYYQRQRKDTIQIHGGGGSLHSNSTPSSHYCTCSCCPWQPLFLSLFSTDLLSLPCSNFADLFWCLFIGKNGVISSSSSSIMVAAHGLHHFYQ